MSAVASSPAAAAPTPTSAAATAPVAAAAPRVDPFKADPKLFGRTVAWASGALAEGLMGAAVGGLLFKVLFNTAYGIDAALVGLAVTIPRLLDAFSDPIIGHVTDNFRSRWGRRRPLMFASCLALALFNAIIWWLPQAWPVWAQVTWLIVFSTLFWQVWGLYTIPRMAMGFELTNDYHGRTRVMATNQFFAILPSLFTSWIYWLCLRPVFNGEINGARWVTLGLSVLIIAVGMLPVIFCREGEAPPRPPKEKRTGIVGSMREACKNRIFLTHVAIRAIAAVGNSIAGGFSFYVIWHYACQGDKTLATQVLGFSGTIFFTMAVISIPLTPRLGRWMGKRTGMLVGLGGNVFSAAIGPIIMTPENPYLVLIGWFFGGTTGICAALFLNSFMADICDLDELKSGQRRQGTYIAVDKFIGKTEMSLLVLVTGVLLSASGFDQRAEVQSPEVVRTMLWYYFGFGISCPVLAFLIALKFPITQAMMEDAQRQLKERREAAAAAEASGGA